MSSAAKVRAFEAYHPVLGALALANAGAITGDYVSLKNAESVDIIFGLAPASGTDTCALTVEQATAVAGTSSKAVAFTTAKKVAAPATSDIPTDDAVTGNSITTSALAALELWVVHVDKVDLDVANGFDCITGKISDPGSVSTPAFVLYILNNPRYAPMVEAAVTD